MPKPARLNDSHSCPQNEPCSHGNGKIVTANNAVIFETEPVACAGDLIECHDGSKAVIQPGKGCVLVNNKRVALVGDQTDHHGKLTTGANSISIDEGEPFIKIGSQVKIVKNVVFKCF